MNGQENILEQWKSMRADEINAKAKDDRELAHSGNCRQLVLRERLEGREGSSVSV